MLKRLVRWLFRRPPPIRILGVGKDVLAPLPDVRVKNYRARVKRSGVWEELD